MPDISNDDDMRKAIDLAKSLYTPSPNETATQGALLPIKRYESGRVEFDPTAGVLGGVTRALTAPGRAYKGEIPEDQMLDEAMNVASQIMLGSAPMGVAQTLREGFDPNVIRTFAGPSSKTADMAALDMAQNLEAKGMGRDFIWQQTGWGRNPAGQWFYEIPDNELRIRPLRIQDGNYVPRESFIGAEVHHPELFQAYPDLRGIKFKMGDIGGYGGEYSRAHNNLPETISIGAEEPREVLTHELGHAVQVREDFPRGGNPADPELVKAAVYVRQKAQEDVDRIFDFKRSFIDDYVKLSKLPKDDVYDRAMVYDLATQRFNQLYPKESIRLEQAIKDTGFQGPTQAYTRLAGEIQPNIAMKSIDWSPIVRREIAPWHREKTPYSSQIVRTQDGHIFMGYDYKADGGRTGYAGKGAVREDDDVRSALDIARQLEDPASRIDADIRALTQNLSGLDIASAFPAFHTGLPQRPQVGGAGLVPPRPSNISDKPLTRTGAEVMAKDPILAANPPMMSERGKPLSELQYQYTPRGNLDPWREKHPEELYKEGAYVTGLVGDRSVANILINAIGNTKLTQPTVTSGGGDFTRSEFARGENPAAWASREAAAKTYMNSLREKGVPEGSALYASHTLMGIPSSDSNHMMMQSLLRQIEPTMGKIDRSAAAKVDDFLSARIPGWPGILKPAEAEAFLLKRNIGTETALLAKALDKANAEKGGFPDVGEARFAVTDPRLLSAPQLSSGYALSKIDLSKDPFQPTDMTHLTYPAKIPSVAGYEGGFRYQVPAEIMFPDWAKTLKLTKHGEPQTETQKTRTLQTQNPIQKANQEWLDNVMKFYEGEKRKWGYREGGRTMGNNAVDNALRMARDHFGYGGDTEFSGSAPERGSTGSASASSYGGGPDIGSHESINAVMGRESPQARERSYSGSDFSGGSQSQQDTMDKVFSSRISGVQNAPLLSMPSNLNELLAFTKQRNDILDQQRAAAEEEAQKAEEIAQSLRSSSFFSPTVSTGFNVNPLGQTMGQASSVLGYNPTDVEGRSIFGPVSSPDASIMGFNAPASQSMMTQQMRDAMTMQGQPTTSSDWQMSDADINKMMSSVNASPITISQNIPVTSTPTVEKSVIFDPVTQSFVPTSQASQQALQLAQAEAVREARVMANLMPAPNAPMAAFPHSPTPSTATQVASYDRPAFPHTPTPATATQVASTSTASQPAVSAPITVASLAHPISTVAKNAPLPTNVVRDAIVAASTPPVSVASASQSPVNTSDLNQDALVLSGRKTFDLPTNAPMPVARPSDVRESNPISSIIDAIRADLAFKEGERINALEAQGKTATFPEYSSASDPLAAQREYLKSIGLNPNDPADMAKVQARIIQQDGQDKVDYYTKSLSEALFGKSSSDQKIDNAVNAAREGGGGDRTPVQQAATQTPTVTPPPYMTELSEGNLALPHPEGLSAQQWANKYAGGDINKVHARIKFINGAPTLEYYTV